MLTSSYPRYPADGVATFVKSLAEALAATHQVHVLAPYDPAVQESPDRVHIKRFRYVLPDSLAMVGHARSLQADIKIKGPVRLLIITWCLAAALQLIRAVRRCQADVIYAQWVLPSGFVAAIVARLLQVPLVIHLHGSDVYVAEHTPLFTSIARWSFDQANAVIACSDDLRNRSMKIGLSPDKCLVIPYGVDTTRYGPGKGDRDLRAQLGIPEKAPLILAMGRLVFKKGFEYLVQAAPQVIAAFPEARFVIAGAGDLADQLLALAKDHDVSGQVTFAGHFPWERNQDYLRLADIFVVPSVVDQYGNVDGLPNTLLEGMSTGLPVVASNVAGIPSVVVNNENGLLVPGRDPDALARAIIQLLESPDLRRKLGTSAREAMVTEFDWSATASRVTVVLRNAVQD